MERAASSTQPGDIFVDLFREVFGLEKAQMLVHEFPYRDFLGTTRFVDYALKTTDSQVAFEIDGPDHYNAALHPGLDAFVAKIEDDLLRQNSLISDRWKVFRWTDRQLLKNPEFVKEQLSLFLAGIPGLLEFDEFLPKQHGEVLELRAHQKDARDWLDRIRQEGKTIALLQHATGTGKTVVAIADAKSVNGRTLYLAHRKDLVTQSRRRFRQFWPESKPGTWLGKTRDNPGEHQVLCASVQGLADDLTEFSPESFDYIIVDEAHHAPADTYKRILGYFHPKFILGLSATPDRPDGKSVLSFFQDAAHRMTIEEAVAKGELVPIRCVRVKTNVDLTRVRFNQIQYNAHDLENALLVPARDELLIDTWLQHVKGRRTVVFCVNVLHGEKLAARFRTAGVSAESVSGRDSDDRRREILRRFEQGQVRVLCACEEANPHGGGIAWRRNGAVEWMKTNSLDEIYQTALKVKGELVIHFRIASVGGVCNELRHPFPITSKANLDPHGRGNAVLFQNGTWSDWQRAIEHAIEEGHKPPTGPMSDTRAAAWLCSIYGHKFLKKLQPSRWVYFSANETATFGQWFKRDGLYFSNLYWQSRPAFRESQATTRATAEPEQHQTKLDRELELWDMQATEAYWQKLDRILPKPVRKH